MSELQGIARFVFHAGELQEFKRLSAQCMEIVRAEDTGTLQYEVYLNADQSKAVVLERYTDSAALIEHAEHIGELAKAIIATGWPTLCQAATATPPNRSAHCCATRDDRASGGLALRRRPRAS